MIKNLVNKKLSNDELNWFNKNISLIEKDESGNKFILAYSLTFRFISDEIVKWNDEELLFLEKQYPSFSKNSFNKQSLCRALLMVTLSKENNLSILKKLFETCSTKEQEDFFKSLYFLENAATLTILAEEGIRTNVENVFDAIALNNPYGAHFLSEGAWNQLVLKAIFMGRPLYKIYNLIERNTLKLALILNDYIHERWSAGRTVSPEIWQLMLGYDHPELQITLKKAEASTNELERKAVQLVSQEISPNTTVNPSAWTEIGIQFNQK